MVVSSRKEIALKKLEPANMDGSGRTGCLENTMTDVLAMVINWVSDPTPNQRTLWLHGPAGSGKSTISTTLADHFRRLKQLGAFLFFDRDVIEGGNPALVVRTLAYQLGSFNSRIGDIIRVTIETSPQTLTSPIHSQFQELLIEPLSSVELSMKSPIVLILDALDECGTLEDRKGLLEVLGGKSVHLPSTVKLVITSRSEHDIRLALEPQIHILTLELDLTSTAINNDLLTYFEHHMHAIQMKNRYLGPDWPGSKIIQILVARAYGLFVWASFACNFIDAHDPRKRLDIILNGSTTWTAHTTLDSLYRTALKHSGVWDDEDFLEDFRAVVGMVLVLRNPLTSAAIDNLLANPDGRPSAQTIGQLSCILSLRPTVRFIHPSLADFLLDRSRCGHDIWYFSPASCERALAILCLRLLEHVLMADMSQCDFLVNDENSVSQDVIYACMFWVDHICMIKDDFPQIETLVEKFIDRHILHWLEAMALLRRFRVAIKRLDRLSEWIQSHQLFIGSGLLRVVRYWWRFAREYESQIQQRPMQVYSEELLKEFQVIDVQEPLVSQSLIPNILELASASPHSLDLQSPQNSADSPISRLLSHHSGSLELVSPVSRPASSRVSTHSRLSRSSLNIPSTRATDDSPVSSVMHALTSSPVESTQIFKFSRKQRSGTSLSFRSRRHSLNYRPTSGSVSYGHRYHRRGASTTSCTTDISQVSSFNVPSEAQSPNRAETSNKTAETTVRSAWNNSLNPALNSDVTQTMMGEFLHKYKRRAFGKGYGQRRHRRFFWVNPYTRMLFWSRKELSSSNVFESRAKCGMFSSSCSFFNRHKTLSTVYFHNVRVVSEPNPIPPGLCPYSIIVLSPRREIKITAPTQKRHNIWLNVCFISFQYHYSTELCFSGPHPSTDLRNALILLF
jgi:hypothetical protein